jgi:hypothetical protein
MTTRVLGSGMGFLGFLVLLSLTILARAAHETAKELVHHPIRRMACIMPCSFPEIWTPGAPMLSPDLGVYPCTFAFVSVPLRSWEFGFLCARKLAFLLTIL